MPDKFKSIFHSRTIIKLFVALLLISIGFIVGFFFEKKDIIKSNQSDFQSKEIRMNAGFKFINPLLDCEISENIINAKKNNFDDELTDFVQNNKDRNKLSDISVYFRDLNNGPAFGVNEDEEFTPASLLKVPAMMTAFAHADTDPNFLKKEVVFTKKIEDELAQSIKPSKEIQLGKTYTLDELVQDMIIYSDNQALYLLYSYISDWNPELYQLLGVHKSVLTDKKPTLTSKEYSAFFRILFNSSFLSRYYSNLALELLTKTEYKKALVAGVPPNIVVAHKFGESGLVNEERELHDCGIIYYPKKPYLLCVMTKGADISTLENYIADVSRFVYNKIAVQH